MEILVQEEIDGKTLSIQAGKVAKQADGSVIVQCGETIVIVTAIAGAHLARTQGLQTMLRVRARLNAGEMPTDDLIDALIIFLAGVVLLTPGFITDAFGILLLIPATRDAFKRWLRQKFVEWSHNTEIHIQRFP